ncbi:hypothetical protein [Streptomyces sp. 2131.1]|uniref:hypothetical protein n=1 Tax=Streptomyces sp. 2131.1 TaxID=1855346 RepID=UPI000B87D681|nr:hypothetical protein [Streptomyces sp. 2131.1]
MILIAGPEKTGKSRVAAEGTASELVGMTYWIEIGGSEGTADYYGRIPGANYEIVSHNGSYQDILDAVRWAVAQPPAVEGKRNMIVVDNVSVLWDMLSDEQALYARWRAERKAQEQRRRGPNPDLPVTVDPDLWNRAKDRWGEILWLLRRHSGPTILLARQELVTAFENDKPTRDKTRKTKAEKNLPASVDAIVELHALGEAYLTGVRTLHWEVTPGQSERFENFSIDTLLRRMGFQEAAAARQVTETRPHAYLDEQQVQREQQQRPQQQRQQRPDQRQGQGPARQDERPKLTGDQAVELIRKALADENNPEAALHNIREQWGMVTLRQIQTRTEAWGGMNADDLITRSLAYAKGRAEQKRQQGTGSAGQAPSAQPSTAPSAPPEQTPTASTATPPAQGQGQGQPEGAREHQTHEDLEPPADDNAPPPPPDPQFDDEPPVDERPEEVSEAEEPQAAPSAPAAAAAPRATRQTRGEKLALKALNAEAVVQARIKMMTVGEHLGPISEAGDPPMTVLRDYLQQHRPVIIAQLEQEGQTELAAYYRKAPTVDPQIQQRFAQYFEGAPAGK